MKFNSQGVICTFFIFFAHQLRSARGEKTVKLIVPHKIKYIHHTHVLLVRPKKKVAAKIQVPVVEDEEDGPSGYQHLQYHDIPRPKGKTKVHYVVPYVAESKEGDIGYHMKKDDEEEEESYYVPIQSYRKGRTHTDDPKYSSGLKRTYKRPANHQEVTAHTSRHPTRYIYPPDPELMKTLKAPLMGLDPQQYETKYMGYSSYSEIEPSGSSSSPYATSSSRPTSTSDTNTQENYYVRDSYQNYVPPYSYSKWVT